MKAYPYIGPPERRELGDLPCARQCVVNARNILDWIGQTHPKQHITHTITATFIVDIAGYLWIADRHYEHVACAQGQSVLSAGEITFAQEDGLEITALSNQSTGYCPHVKTWPAVARALSRAQLTFPATWTLACTFARCTQCHTLHLIKHESWICAVCNADDLHPLG